MAIPDFQSLMLPLLHSLENGSECGTQDTLDAMAAGLGLTEADVTQPMPSRKAPLLTNRVAWAKLHLKRAGLIESPRRGVYRITERGREVLRMPPERVTLGTLPSFPSTLSSGRETGRRTTGTPRLTSIRMRTELPRSILTTATAGFAPRWPTKS